MNLLARIQHKILASFQLYSQANSWPISSIFILSLIHDQCTVHHLTSISPGATNQASHFEVWGSTQAEISYLYWKFTCFFLNPFRIVFVWFVFPPKHTSHQLPLLYSQPAVCVWTTVRHVTPSHSTLMHSADKWLCIAESKHKIEFPLELLVGELSRPAVQKRVANRKNERA